MRVTAAIFIVLTLFILIACDSTKGAQDVPRITKEDLRGKLGSPDIELIDVRSGSDWERSSEKVLGAKRLDPQMFDSWADSLPKDKEIILYCA